MTKTKTHLYFWGGILSNWAEVPGGIKVQDEDKTLIFPTSEHLFMWFKASCFFDVSAMKKILQAKTPKEAKAIGRGVKNFDEETWEENREKFMLKALKYKAMSWPDFKNFVIEETRTFVEASPYDKIWGIGMNEEEAARVDNPEKWNGLNLLGKSLCNLRTWLIENEN
jgi:ribA/ribD-fused uncharacterized protein